MVYVLLAALLLGLPVILDPGGTVAGSNPTDSRLFAWSLAWWPHALTSGLNPITTDLLYVPDGYDLLWTTSIPGIALLLWPLTALAGPIGAYNVAMVLAPALSSWIAFLLCREITGRVAPSLVGGFIFGFSSHMLSVYAGGHLHLAWMFLIPAAALLAVRHVRGRLSTRAYGILMALLVIAEFLISTEVLLTMVLFGIGLLVAAWVVLPERRPRLTETIKATVIGGAAAAVILSPLLWHVLGSTDRPDVPTENGVIDFLNPLFPTELTAAGHSTFAEVAARYTGSEFTRGGYLGIPLLVLVAVWAAGEWRERRREGRLLLGFAVVSMVFALGPGLRVTGLTTVLLPWWPMTHLPLFRYVLPHRFMAFVALAIGLAVAVWLAEARGRAVGRWVLAAVAVLALLPAVGSARYHHDRAVPEFFTSGQYRSVLKPDDRVFVVPYGPYGPSMDWQQEADFGFELIGGYAEPPPPDYERPVIQELSRNERFSPTATDELRRFLADKGATVALVDAARPEPGLTILKALGVEPQELGGVYVARLSP